jgi:hypothetical protein
VVELDSFLALLASRAIKPTDDDVRLMPVVPGSTSRCFKFVNNEKKKSCDQILGPRDLIQQTAAKIENLNRQQTG